MCSRGTQNYSPDTQNCSLDAQHGVLEAGLSVLEAGLGGPERHLGDYCVLLHGLGRFQNALELFQEAPERESLIFHWFWEVLGGAHHARAMAEGGLSDPLNQDFSRQTKHHWNWETARAGVSTRASTGAWARVVGV